MSELKHMHAKTECLPFNTEDVRLIITERYGKQEIRMHGEDARFIVEAIAAAKRRTQPEATKGDSLRTSLADLAMALWRTHYRNDSPNFELLPDAAGILSQIDNMVSGLVKPEATKPAQDLSAAIPDGWQLVPIEPTPEMLDKAGHDLYWQAESCEYPQTVLEFQADAHTAWRAMLLASPACAMTQTRIVMLLREARATLEMWKDVAPAVSLCADIDAALASPADALVEGDSETAKDTERLDFVLENGVPMMRNGEYRFHGFPGKWFKTDREAIDFAIQAQKDGHGHD